MKIFIFGSLLSQEVLNSVINDTNISLDQIQESTIDHYKAQYVQDEDYPMLQYSLNSSVVGKIIQIEDTNKLDRLKYYEGAENPLTLVLEHDNLYAFIADSSLTASSKSWSYKEWLESSTHLTFIKRVEKYMKYFQKSTEVKW